jgi:hypothetical protein
MGDHQIGEDNEGGKGVVYYYHLPSRQKGVKPRMPILDGRAFSPIQPRITSTPRAITNEEAGNLKC